MTPRFDLNANKVTLFTGSYLSLVAAQTAASPLIAAGYVTYITEDGLDFILNGSLLENIYESWPTEAAANASASGYVATGYRVSIFETVEVVIPFSDYKILYSPSKYRTPVQGLDGGYFSPTLAVAVFVDDPFNYLGITQVEFKLDTVSVNIEAVAPWDYAMTDGFGNANRVTFSAGLHLIEAVVTATTGNFTLSANFEVE